MKSLETTIRSNAKIGVMQDKNMYIQITTKKAFDAIPLEAVDSKEDITKTLRSEIYIVFIYYKRKRKETRI